MEEIGLNPEYEKPELPTEPGITSDPQKEFNWLEDLKGLNKELEERIIEANKDTTKVKWNKLLPDLMGADVLMVGQFSNQVDEFGNKQLNIMMMQKDGHIIVPFFTSPERIGVMANPSQTQFDVMKIHIVRFFQSMAGKPVVMNPLSDCGRVFSPFEMKILTAENLHRAPLLHAKKTEGN